MTDAIVDKIVDKLYSEARGQAEAEWRLKDAARDLISSGYSPERIIKGEQQ